TITVMADPATLTSAEDAAAGAELSWPVLAVLVAAAVLLVIVISSLVTGISRRHRRKRAARAAAATTVTASTTEPPVPAEATSEAPAPVAEPAGDLTDTAVIPVRRSARRREE